MSWEILFRKAARDEFDEAYDWYENQKEGLGDDFAKHVQDVLDSLKLNPKVHAKVHKDARKAVVRKFPYCVYYVIQADHVHVVAVFHDRRNPRKWKSRI